MDNTLEIIGTVKEALRFNHEMCGKSFYTTKVACERESGTIDLLPIITPEELTSDIKSDSVLYIRGSFRSFNEKATARVRLYIYVEEVRQVTSGVKSINNIWLTGYVCKQPTFRLTPKGTRVCDVMLAVQRNCGQSDYIPLIMWNDNADRAGKLRIGEEIKLDGRIQSRTYMKQLNGIVIQMTAYEVSVGRFESMEE